MSQLEIGSVFAGHRVEAVAGRGGMGVVYRAIQLDLERPVALKLISPELGDDAAFRARFEREARLAAAIDHPNIVPVYRAGEVEGQLFLTTRYVPGTDLRQLIADRGRLEPEQAVRIVAQVAAALDAAHARGLVHRDVKPANILITGDEGDEHAYLTDFGLTKHASSKSGLTRTGQFIGTLDYVSPEQIEGRQADARSDVYSLGCVLFHALTGSRPFERENDIAKMYAHVNDPAPTPTSLVSGVPGELGDVVARALAKSPDDRYPSAGDLSRAALAAIEQQQPPMRERSVAVGPAAPGPAAPTAPAGQTDAADTEAAEMRPEEAAAGIAETEPVPAAAEPTEPAAAEPTVPAAAEPTVPAGGPTDATEPTRPELPQAPAGGRRRRLGPGVAAALGLLALAVVGIVVATVLGGGGDGDEAAETSPASGSALAPAPISTSGWQDLPRIPTARQFAVSAVADGEIWVMGGLTERGATDKVEVYDPAAGRWREGPSLPRPLHHAIAIPYRGEPVILGGWVPRGSNLRATTSDKVYAMREGRWVELPSLPRPRAAGAASVVGDTLVVFGGQGSDGSLLRQADRFDGARWRAAAPLPTPRTDLAGATERRLIYAAGGRARGSRESSGAFERYDPKTNRWRKLPDLPTPRAGLMIAIAREHVVAAGGADGGRALTAVEAFDIAGAQWGKLPNLPTPRYGLAVESYRRGVYALTGTTATGPGSLTTAANVLRFARERTAD